MSTIKNIKNKEKNLGKIYSPFGKFAERATMFYNDVSNYRTMELNSVNLPVNE